MLYLTFYWAKQLLILPLALFWQVHIHGSCDRGYGIESLDVQVSTPQISSPSLHPTNGHVCQLYALLVWNPPDIDCSHHREQNNPQVCLAPPSSSEATIHHSHAPFGNRSKLSLHSTSAPIVGGNNFYDWNKPFWWWRRWKHQLQAGKNKMKIWACQKS